MPLTQQELTRLQELETKDRETRDRARLAELEAKAAGNMGWGEYADNLVRQAANGATFGFADEISAGGNAAVEWAKNKLTRSPDASLGDLYDRNLSAERSKDKAFETQFPMASGAANVTGGVAGAIAAAPEAAIAAASSRLLPNVARSAAIGGAAGALQGFGTGEGGLGNRLESAAGGAALGGVIGGVLPVVASGVSAGIKKAGEFFPDAPTRAWTKLEQALGRDKMTPQQLSQRLQDLGPEASIADAGGDALTRLSRAVAGTPGDAGEAAAKFFNGRQEGQGARLAEAVRSATGAKGDYFGTLDDLLAQRSTDAAPLYEKAFSNKPVWNERIQQFLDDPDSRKGLREGLTVLRREALAQGKPFRYQDFAVTGFNEAGDPILSGVPNMRTLDAIKRGYDEMLEAFRDPVTRRLNLNQQGRALDDVRRAFVDELDVLNPDYKAARASWAGPSQSKDALEMGRTFIKNPEEVTGKILERMNGGEREFFREGVTRALRDMIYNADDGANAVRRIFGNRAIRAKLEAAFPDKEAYDQFAKSMQTEAAFYGKRAAVLQGSRTAPMLADMADLSADPLVPGADALKSAGAKAVQGSYLGAAGDLLRAGMERWKRPPEAVANELAPLLFSGDPAKNAATLQRLIAPPPPPAPKALPPEVRRLQGALLGGGAYAGGLLGGRQ